MPVTHCIPAGSPWNVNQVPRPGVNAISCVTYNPPSGLRRGRIIYFPPTGGNNNEILNYENISGVAQSGAQGQQPTDPYTFLQNALLDGWQVIAVNNFGQDYTVAVPLPVKDWIVTDVSNDSGHGSRWVQTVLHYFDHILLYAQQNQGGPMPTLVAGFSMGAWVSLQIALGRTSAIIGYIARSAPTQWSNTGSTASSIVFPQMAGVNTSGIDLQSMSELTVNSFTHSGSAGAWSVVLTCSASTSAISTGQWVVVDNTSNINGYWQVTGQTGSTLTISVTQTATPTSSTGNVRTNTTLNALTLPGAIMFGAVAGYTGDSLFVNPNDLGAMSKTAAAAGQPVTTFDQGGVAAYIGAAFNEGHQWSTNDSNLLSVTTYDSSKTYSAGQWVYYSGNVYQALGSTTGNVPTNATYWGNSYAQSAQGWLETTFDAVCPKAW